MRVSVTVEMRDFEATNSRIERGRSIRGVGPATHVEEDSGVGRAERSAALSETLEKLSGAMILPTS